jgi:hypothetical protein
MGSLESQRLVAQKLEAQNGVELVVALGRMNVRGAAAVVVVVVVARVGGEGKGQVAVASLTGVGGCGGGRTCRRDSWPEQTDSCQSQIRSDLSPLLALLPNQT